MIEALRRYIGDRETARGPRRARRIPAAEVMEGRQLLSGLATPDVPAGQTREHILLSRRVDPPAGRTEENSNGDGLHGGPKDFTGGPGDDVTPPSNRGGYGPYMDEDIPSG